MGNIETLFDDIFVVSLPSSTDRRAYIQEHLETAGIHNFKFHEACDGAHPDVQAYFTSGRVHSYPPCFRCGKASCGRDSCNNVLIPAQVATFVTYLKLWEKIAAKPQVCPVVEDDLALNPYWLEVIAQLSEAKQSGQIDLAPQHPRLLRLGWALNDEHDGTKPFRLSNELRMSNPCHSLTSAFAQALLDRFRKIDTTVDLYMHKDAPRPGEALTVFPPLASELYWSKGAFDSLIHPKPIRAAFLETQGRHAEAQEVLKQAHHHMRHTAHKGSGSA